MQSMRRSFADHRENQNYKVKDAAIRMEKKENFRQSIVITQDEEE